MLKFECFSLDDTKSTAEYLSKFAKKSQCFALYGDLGYGKTAFAKYLIQSLNKNITDVTSPTFTIVQSYECDISEIWHVDCYRIRSDNEIYELGLEEAFLNCIIIIEWPEIIEKILPKNTIKIKFSIDGSIRIIEVDL